MSREEDYRKGHRERMRSSYLERGGDAFEDYQLLEMLLFYAIPRIDVKPLAKELIKHFGSFEKVISASAQQLQKISGIGPNAAVLIKLVFDSARRISDNRCCGYKVIDEFGTAVNYFLEMFRFENRIEKFAGMLLDNLNRIIKCCFISEGVVDSVAVNIRKFMEIALENNATGIIIAHNHPGGEAYPSCEDIDFTLNLQHILHNVNVSLLDHIILNEKEGFSMHSSIEFVAYFERHKKG